MPTNIIVAHDRPKFLQPLIDALAGPDRAVIGFDEPDDAMQPLATLTSVAILITRMRFGTRQPVGLSFARVVRARFPEARIIFVAQPEFQPFTEGLGAFIAAPVKIKDVVSAVQLILEPPHATS